jgi:hypothetical protein
LVNIKKHGDCFILEFEYQFYLVRGLRRFFVDMRGVVRGGVNGESHQQPQRLGEEPEQMALRLEERVQQREAPS